MTLTYVPLLKIQRDLYDLPRNMERFKAYIATMTDPVTNDLKYPLVLMNPMGKEHVPVLPLITCLFGDEAGATLGYPRLGFTRRAGLALALADARRPPEGR